MQVLDPAVPFFTAQTDELGLASGQVFDCLHILGVLKFILIIPISIVHRISRANVNY